MREKNIFAFEVYCGVNHTAVCCKNDLCHRQCLTVRLSPNMFRFCLEISPALFRTIKAAENFQQNFFFFFTNMILSKVVFLTVYLHDQFHDHDHGHDHVHDDGHHDHVHLSTQHLHVDLTSKTQ